MPRANMLHNGLIGAAAIAAAGLLVNCGAGDGDGGRGNRGSVERHF